MLKEVMRGQDIRGIVSYIQSKFFYGYPLKLREYNIEFVVPHVYDIFIREWGMLCNMLRGPYTF